VAKTFSRAELLQILRETKLTQIQEYFPFPDYKIPSSVLSSALIDRYPGLSSEIALHKPFDNYGLPRKKYFPDPLALRSVGRAGLLKEFSNSFLFLASPEGESATLKRLTAPSERALGWHYSAERQTPVVTVFSEKNGVLGCEKSRDSKEDSARLVAWKESAWESVRSLVSLREKIERTLYFSQSTDPEVVLGDWIEFIEWSFEKWAIPSANEKLLQGEAIDAVWSNSLLDPAGGYHLFDLEWVSKEPIEIGYFLFRNILNLRSVSELFPEGHPFQSLGTVYQYFCKYWFLTEDLDRYIEAEARLQAELNWNTDSEVHKLELKKLFSRPVRTFSFPRKPLGKISEAKEVFRTLPPWLFGKLKERLDV
jgi:hypothetical protein